MPDPIWDDMTDEEKGNAFRAHHIGGMPYPGQVNVDAELAELFPTDD